MRNTTSYWENHAAVQSTEMSRFASLSCDHAAYKWPIRRAGYQTGRKSQRACAETSMSIAVGIGQRTGLTSLYSSFDNGRGIVMNGGPCYFCYMYICLFIYIYLFIHVWLYQYLWLAETASEFAYFSTCEWVWLLAWNKSVTILKRSGNVSVFNFCFVLHVRALKYKKLSYRRGTAGSMAVLVNSCYVARTMRSIKVPNSKSDLQCDSRSSAMVPFNRSHTISC